MLTALVGALHGNVRYGTETKEQEISRSYERPNELAYIKFSQHRLYSCYQ